MGDPPAAASFQAPGKAKAPRKASVENGLAERLGRPVGALCSVLGLSGEREQCLEAPGTPCPVSSPASPALWHTASPRLCPAWALQVSEFFPEKCSEGKHHPHASSPTNHRDSQLHRFGGPRGAASLEGWAVFPRVTSPQPNLTVSPCRAPLSPFYGSGLGLELPDARMQNQNQMFPQLPAQLPAVLGGGECETALGAEDVASGAGLVAISTHCPLCCPNTLGSEAPGWLHVCQESNGITEWLGWEGSRAGTPSARLGCSKPHPT